MCPCNILLLTIHSSIQQMLQCLGDPEVLVLLLSCGGWQISWPMILSYFLKKKRRPNKSFKMQLSCAPQRSSNNRLLRWCLQVPAVKLYYKSLSVLPQDRLLDPDVVRLYFVLFSSLISKPDLSSAHRDPIFYCEHSKSGKCAEGMAQTPAGTRGRCSLCGGNGSGILPMLEWELWSKLSVWKMVPLFFLLGIALQASSSSWLSHWSCQGREHIALCSFFALPWLLRLSFGNLTATSLCRALDNMEPGLTQTYEFPSLKP